jgi:cysteine desulfurase/selenocysteine lyase
MPLDVKKIRKDFPILRNGIIYLDNAASSLTPEPVVERMLSFYREYRANVERGVHRLSQRATAEFEKARREIQKLLSARAREEVIFTKNTTEGINTVATGLKWKKGDRIVTTLIEHHSNLIPWQRVAKTRGVELAVIPPGPDGQLSVADFEREIDDNTRLVAVAHVSNVLGSILPVRDIVKIAHEHGALVLVDGAQSVPHFPVDVRKLGCDFLAFSGHKMLGPTGIGVLYARSDVVSELEPLAIGGGSIERVGPEDYVLAPAPEGFEAGTPPIAEAIALGEAARYLRAVGLREISRHEKLLVRILYAGLASIEKVEIYGPGPRERAGIVSFNVGGLSPHDVAATLDNAGKIMVRSGHHCAMPLHSKILKRPDGSVRASLYLYNTKEEIEKLVAVVEEVARVFA